MRCAASVEPGARIQEFGAPRAAVSRTHVASQGIFENRKEKFELATEGASPRHSFIILDRQQRIVIAAWMRFALRAVATGISPDQNRREPRSSFSDVCIDTYPRRIRFDAGYDSPSNFGQIASFERSNIRTSRCRNPDLFGEKVAIPLVGRREA